MFRVEGTQTIKGIRTDCATGKKYEVELKYYVKLGGLYKLWFYLVNGVTGYESFEFCPNTIQRLPLEGWSACAGTPNQYDKLFIPPEEIKKGIYDIIDQLHKGG